ncbi:hypothetical protein BV22DRAFT_1122847 [Leucogyrophana mollusca]|uniref:Uncharacterized protein n=1 Tax=Leucogyrophana mollusca TaxID=85980 RepID=A0ACB8B5Z4_9AGAM|nr:hypothetical protein BV22DRAFT_1122847 [Leucogyrophana mollusca]
MTLNMKSGWSTIVARKPVLEEIFTLAPIFTSDDNATPAESVHNGRFRYAKNAFLMDCCPICTRYGAPIETFQPKLSAKCDHCEAIGGHGTTRCLGTLLVEIDAASGAHHPLFAKTKAGAQAKHVNFVPASERWRQPGPSFPEFLQQGVMSPYLRRATPDVHRCFDQ